MKVSLKLVLASTGGILLGGAAIHALHAQARPAAYTIAEFEVTDAAGFKAYGDATGTQVPAAGGKFLARGGKMFVVAGEAPKRAAIIEWPTIEKAQAYFESSEYKQLVPNRDKSSKFRSFVVEGIEK